MALCLLISVHLILLWAVIVILHLELSPVYVHNHYVLLGMWISAMIKQWTARSWTYPDMKMLLLHFITSSYPYLHPIHSRPPRERCFCYWIIQTADSSSVDNWIIFIYQHMPNNTVVFANIYIKKVQNDKAFYGRKTLYTKLVYWSFILKKKEDIWYISYISTERRKGNQRKRKDIPIPPVRQLPLTTVLVFMKRLVSKAER